MQSTHVHSFHIPVLGLSFSIDTPLRVARFGIASVISIVDDVLIERMREHYARLYDKPYTAIHPKEEDHRARRISAYLNLVNQIVQEQVAKLKSSAFTRGSEITRYFELLPDGSPLKALYRRMLATEEERLRSALEDDLRSRVVAGPIDVNIMTKLDKANYGANGTEPVSDASDAVAALRGFVRSDLRSSVVLSAGLNQRLFNYMERCAGFLPGPDGTFDKGVVLKVSDYRSAFLQGKILAKKGIWISEYRIESGLNCGGHAFPTEGVLLGPILEEFKEHRSALIAELHTVYCKALREKECCVPAEPRTVRITVQGGIGTHAEDEFLREFFAVDGTGWGSPFLLVPEATNVDDDTRNKLAAATKDDYYISDASPLGVSFNNLRGSSSEAQIRRRVRDGRPGSPCTKKYLISNTEFTKEPICTASRQYQSLKINQLEGMGLPPEEKERRIREVVDKSCLCEDLAASPFVHEGMTNKRDSHAVAVCPGPNLAYFSRIATLEEMIGHIYGRLQLIGGPDRPNMFVNELRLYVDYLKKELGKRVEALSGNEQKYLTTFRENLQRGIDYYMALVPRHVKETERYRETMREQLEELAAELENLIIPLPA